MLYAHFPDASCFKKILDTIQHYGTVLFHFSPAGLRLQGIDEVGVSLVHVILKAQQFDGYICEKDIKMGIHLPQFYKMVKLAYKSNGLTISDSDDENQIKVEFASEAGVKRTIDIQNMNVSFEELEIPELIVNCVATIPCGEFLQIVQEASLMFEAISIKNNGNDGIEIVSKTDLANNSNTIKAFNTIISTNHCASNDEKVKIVVSNHNEFNKTYNLRHLKLITKAVNLSPSIALKFCTKFLLVEFKILGLGSMQFFLPEKNVEDAKADDIN